MTAEIKDARSAAAERASLISATSQSADVLVHVSGGDRGRILTRHVYKDIRATVEGPWKDPNEVSLGEHRSEKSMLRGLKREPPPTSICRYAAIRVGSRTRHASFCSHLADLIVTYRAASFDPVSWSRQAPAWLASSAAPSAAGAAAADCRAASLLTARSDEPGRSLRAESV